MSYLPGVDGYSFALSVQLSENSYTFSDITHHREAIQEARREL